MKLVSRALANRWTSIFKINGWLEDFTQRFLVYIDDDVVIDVLWLSHSLAHLLLFLTGRVIVDHLWIIRVKVSLKPRLGLGLALGLHRIFDWWHLLPRFVTVILMRFLFLFNVQILVEILFHCGFIIVTLIWAGSVILVNYFKLVWATEHWSHLWGCVWLLWLVGFVVVFCLLKDTHIRCQIL